MFAGYRKQRENSFEHNPGLSSRIPYTFLFEGYTNGELMKILSGQDQRMLQRANGRGLLGRRVIHADCCSANW